MHQTFPRILYTLAVLSWAILLWPYPITIFLAACFSCLTLPVYKYLRYKSSKWRRKIKKQPGKLNRFFYKLSNIFPVAAYATFIIASLLTPLLLLALLVSPQAVAGLDRLQQLRASNFQIPPHWMEYFHAFRAKLAEYPPLERAFNEALSNMESLLTDTVGMLVSRSFGFVGSTMNAFWLSFLFITLTILFTVHARLGRKLLCRILHLRVNIINRFLTAIFKALKAITMGIAFVALIQGILCGIGFAVAGVNQPAFWGMLATMVAPIPMVGTALVWLPLCIALWFSGKTMAALGLGLWGAIFVAGIDNVFRPFFLRQGIHAPFFVLILAILCGLGAFGAVGLIAGPVLLALGVQAYEEGNRYYRNKF